MNFYNLIREWATARNIISDSTASGQLGKALTEAGELWDHLCSAKYDLVKDDIGDVIVCLTNSLTIAGVNIEDVCESNDFGIHKETIEKHGPVRASFVLLRSLAAMSGCVEDWDDTKELTPWNEITIINSAAVSVKILAAIANHFGWTLEQCVEEAYNDIKDRRGLMYKGIFIKESSLKPDVVATILADENLKSSARAYLEEFATKQ